MRFPCGVHVSGGLLSVALRVSFDREGEAGVLRFGLRPERFIVLVRLDHADEAEHKQEGEASSNPDTEVAVVTLFPRAVVASGVFGGRDHRRSLFLDRQSFLTISIYPEFTRL